jgi:hypothetical protein
MWNELCRTTDVAVYVASLSQDSRCCGRYLNCAPADYAPTRYIILLLITIITIFYSY